MFVRGPFFWSARKLRHSELDFDVDTGGEIELH